MNICKVLIHGETLWAEVHNGNVYRLEGNRFARPTRGPALGPLGQTKLLPPIEAHNKVVGMLGNWGDKRGREGPGLFIKANSTLIGTDDTIQLPKGIEAIVYEAELGVVIGRKAKHVPVAQALDYVLGYTVTNDVTCSTLYKAEPGSGRFKLFDTFGPMGPWITTGLDPANLRLRSRLNGQQKQDVQTTGFAFTVPEAIAWATSVMTLEPGDVISMGSAPGVAQLNPGDIVECEIVEVGTLRNPVTRPA